jgi:hypothetical protein
MNCGYCGHTMLRHCSKGCTVNDCECTVRYPDPLAPTNYVDRQQQLQKKAHNQGLEFSDLQGQYSSFGFRYLSG